MRIPRLYHPAELHKGAEVRLNPDQAAHVMRVLRLSAGDDVKLFDGEGHEYDARLLSVARDAVIVQLGEPTRSRPESSLDTCLMQGICRGARMDLVIQKATELGVTRIVPIRCERSVVRLDAKRAERRLEHWRGIAVAAAEQCGRAQVPKVDPPSSLPDAVAALPSGSRGLLLSPDARTGIGSMPEAATAMCLLIGPEGGLTAEERALAIEEGFEEYALGPRILRSETAALTALVLVQFLRGDLDGS